MTNRMSGPRSQKRKKTNEIAEPSDKHKKPCQKIVTVLAPRFGG